jgi:hypothetical protein
MEQQNHLTATEPCGHFESGPPIPFWKSPARNAGAGLAPSTLRSTHEATGCKSSLAPPENPNQALIGFLPDMTDYPSDRTKATNS